MQKAWWAKVFLLYMVCMLCMCGLCAAEEEEKKENLVECYVMDDYNIFYVDTNSIKAREYNGRKYLELFARRKETYFESIPFLGGFWNKRTTAKWHLLYDIAQDKAIALEWEDNSKKPKKGTNDISAIENSTGMSNSDRQIVAWVSNHYPSIIQEINTANGGKQAILGGAGHSTSGGESSNILSKFPSLDVTYDDMVYDAYTDTYRNYGTYHFYNNGPRLPMDAGAPSGLKYIYTLRYFSNRKNVDFSIDYYLDPQSVSRYSGISGDTVRGIFYRHISHDDWDGWSTWTVQGFKVYIDYNWYSVFGMERDEENAIRWGWGPVANAAAFDETRHIYNDEDVTPEEIEHELTESPSYCVLLDEYIGKPALRFHAKEDTQNDHGGDPHYNSSYFDDQLRAIALLSAVDD